MISTWAIFDFLLFRAGSMFGDMAKIAAFSSFLPPITALTAPRHLSNRVLAEPHAGRSLRRERSISGYPSGGPENLYPATPRSPIKDPERQATGHQRQAEAWRAGSKVPQFPFESRLHNKSAPVKPILQSSLFCCRCLGLSRFWRAGGVSLSDIDLSAWRLFSSAAGAIPRMGARRFLVIPSRSRSRILFIPSLTVTHNHANCA